MTHYKKSELFYYGAFGFPIAFVGLPILVHIPKYYASEVGISLGVIGFILLIVRIIDGVQDPLIGYFSDKFNRNKNFQANLIFYSSPFLAASFVFLFYPMNLGDFANAVWLGFMLVIVYSFFSVININYQALAAEIAGSYHERTRVNIAREACTLIGVLFAAALPQVLSEAHGMKTGFLIFSLIFIPVIMLPAFILKKFCPLPVNKNKPQKNPSIFRQFYSVLKNRQYIWLLAVLIVNGVAVGIPATLFLFFVEDVLGAKSQSHLFLIVYFLSGALGMPLWSFLSKKFGKRNSWIFSMLSAAITFVWAFTLKEGDIWQFYIICVLSGISLGADNALPGSILADVIENGEKKNSNKTASYFAMWNFAIKLTLALSAGIALPLLGVLGYLPGEENSAKSIMYLAMAYALIPCMLKVLALFLLSFSNLDKFRSKYE